MANPGLYGETMSHHRSEFFASMLRWTLEGIWHSLVLFLFPLYALTTSRSDGTTDALYVFGVGSFTAVVIVVNLKAGPALQPHWLLHVETSQIRSEHQL